MNSLHFELLKVIAADAGTLGPTKSPISKAFTVELEALRLATVAWLMSCLLKLLPTQMCALAQLTLLDESS